MTARGLLEQKIGILNNELAQTKGKLMGEEIQRLASERLKKSYSALEARNKELEAKLIDTNKKLQVAESRATKAEEELDTAKKNFVAEKVGSYFIPMVTN